MSDSLHDQIRVREHYERHFYPAVVAPESHPSRMAATAMLYGCDPVGPERASILEIGCGRGFNLAEIARTTPASRCLGLDISEPQIAEARRTHGDLPNLEFRVGNLLDFDPGDQSFDYIIAHGFLSWVPDAAKVRLMEVGRDHLASNGLMYVSYNCYPAWSLREGLAKLGCLDMADETDIARGLDTLTTLGRAAEGFEKTPYQSFLRATIRSIQEQPVELLPFDEFAPINDPCYFADFVDLAASHDLAYVADARLDVDWPGSYPEAARAVWAEAKLDRLRALQQADWLALRSFRQSIVCHTNRADRIVQAPQADRVGELWVRSHLEPDGPSAVTPGQPVAYRRPDEKGRGAVMQTDHVELQTLLDLIQRRQGQELRGTHLRPILTEAAGESIGDLCSSLLELACRRHLDLWAR